MPLAAFGAIVGTIAGIAAASAQREYYERPYYAPGYYERAGATATTSAARLSRAACYHYALPVYQQRDYYSRWGGSGGQPGYRPERERAGPTATGMRPATTARCLRRANGQPVGLMRMHERRPRGPPLSVAPWSGHILRQKFTC